jgi:hypothetical protein
MQFVIDLMGAFYWCRFILTCRQGCWLHVASFCKILFYFSVYYPSVLCIVVSRIFSLESGEVLYFFLFIS